MGAKYGGLNIALMVKEKRLTIGVYPVVGLKLAREKAQQAKLMLIDGIDPSAAKEQAKAERLAQAKAQAKEVEILAYTFTHEFDAWHRFKLPSWSNGYADDVKARARMYLLPRLGKMPLVEIKPIDVLDTLTCVMCILMVLFAV